MENSHTPGAELFGKVFRPFWPASMSISARVEVPAGSRMEPDASSTTSVSAHASPTLLFRGSPDSIHSESGTNTPDGGG